MNFTDFLDFPKLLLQAIKDPKFLLPIVVASGGIIFFPIVILEKLGIAILTEKLRPLIGFIFIVSAIALICVFLFRIGSYIGNRILSRFTVRIVRKNLRKLSHEEKVFLSEYLINNSKTKYAEMDDGVARGLEYANIIYRASAVGKLMEGFPFNLQPCAWEELIKNPEILEPELSQYRKNPAP